MCVYYFAGVYDIKLDISEIVPENVRVFYVMRENDDLRNYGTIQGDQNNVNSIKENLIHDLNEVETIEEESKKDSSHTSRELSLVGSGSGSRNGNESWNFVLVTDKWFYCFFTL